MPKAIANPVAAPTSQAKAVTPERMTILLTDLPSSPLSGVPGMQGASFTSFDEPYLSPDGSNWMITADTDLPFMEDDVLIVNGSLALREGDSPSYVDAGDRLDSFNSRASINDAGQFAFTHFTEDPNGANQFVVRGQPSGVFDVIARRGSQVLGAPTGWLIDGFSGSANITSNGTVWYEADSVTNTPTMSSADDNLIAAGSSIFLQNGVSVPAGQMTSSSETWESFDNEDLYVSADGSQYLLQGDLNGDISTDDVLVVNGTVVLQEGFAIPGGPTDAVDTISESFMHGSGHWTANGLLSNGASWVVADGSIVAMGGAPIHVGTNEAFTFFRGSTCNGLGDFVVVGATDDPDFKLDSVVVVNNDRVLLREGDPVDLDGNGIFDDDLEFHFFVPDSFRLGDDGMLYFLADVRVPTGVSSVGTILLAVNINEEPGVAYCTTNPNSTGIASSLIATGSSAVASNDITLITSDLPIDSFGFFIVSTSQGFVMNPGGSQGNLCLSGAIGRYVGPGQIMSTGSTGQFQLTIDLNAIPGPLGPMAAVAGDEWNFQLWHRDLGGPTGATSNLSNGYSITFN